MKPPPTPLDRNNLERLRRDPVIEAVASFVSERGGGYLVGGAVREMLTSGLPTRDYDFAVSCEPRPLSEELARRFSGSAFLLDKESGSFRVAVKKTGSTIDVAAVKEGGITPDLQCRDFTVNAVAIELGELTRGGARLIDPSGGVEDGRLGLLRMVSPSAFSEDPLRTLRAVRLATGHGLAITAETAAAVKKAAPLIGGVSVERIRDELLIIFSRPGAAEAIRMMTGFALTGEILPFTRSWGGVEAYDLTGHVLSTIDECDDFLRGLEGGSFSRLSDFFGGDAGQVERAAVLRLAALLHDAGKPATMRRAGGKLSFRGHERTGAEIAGKALRALAFPKRVSGELTALTAGHHRAFNLWKIEKPTSRARINFFRSVGPETALMLLALAVADARATSGVGAASFEAFASSMVDFYFDTYLSLDVKPLLGGREIMDIFGVKEGSVVGELLRLISAGEESGAIESREEAVALVVERLKERGPG